jgi:hypothetical protein
METCNKYESTLVKKKSKNAHARSGYRHPHKDGGNRYRPQSNGHHTMTRPPKEKYVKRIYDKRVAKRDF